MRDENGSETSFYTIQLLSCGIIQWDGLIKMEKHNWINDSIAIDFVVPKSLQEIISILEQMDEDEDYGYYEYSEVLDYGAKEYVYQGVLTKKQWQTLCLKYDGEWVNVRR